jgi:hypothetical protein
MEKKIILDMTIGAQIKVAIKHRPGVGSYLEDFGHICFLMVELSWSESYPFDS